MSWKAEDPQGHEAAKCKYDIVQFTRGVVLDLGCGANKAFPHFIGVDNCKDTQLFGVAMKPDVVDDCATLSKFEPGQCDAIFSSHLLEHIDYERVPAVLDSWCKVVKTDGHLILYLPDEDEYPRIGQPGANPDHKWDVNYEKVIAAMDAVERSWDLIEYQKRNGGAEYSLLFVFKLQ
jgi:predicted SAM-dependent methyltransferase